MRLTSEELKSTMWDAANTLRGSAVDRTDWKGYILPLLFFKRICDVWDEETTEAARDLRRSRSGHVSRGSSISSPGRMPLGEISGKLRRLWGQLCCARCTRSSA